VKGRRRATGEKKKKKSNLVIKNSFWGKRGRPDWGVKEDRQKLCCGVGKRHINFALLPFSMNQRERKKGDGANVASRVDCGKGGECQNSLVKGERATQNLVFPAIAGRGGRDPRGILGFCRKKHGEAERMAHGREVEELET